MRVSNMETDYSLMQKIYLQQVYSKEFITEKLISIYNEILSIEKEFPTIFNKNISFINKIYRHDPLFIEALKSMNIAECILSKRTLSQKELMRISSEFSILKEEHVQTVIQYENIKIILKNAKSKEVFYQAFAAASYYKEFEIGQIIQTTYGAFVVTSQIENNEGLRALYFEPLDDLNGSPILSIRGTVSSHIGNVLDDLHSSIGSLAFQSGKDQLFELLSKSLLKFLGGCVIVGHSLGGAIAQQTAAAFVKERFIKQVYYFNSPGVGLEVVNAFISSCRQLEIFPEIIEVRHENDLVSFFGGDHLPLTNRLIVKDREIITYRAAHEILRMMEKSHMELVAFEVAESLSEIGFWQGRFNYFTVETLRWTFAPLLRFIACRWYATIQSANPNTSEIEDVTEEASFLHKHHLT